MEALVMKILIFKIKIRIRLRTGHGATDLFQIGKGVCQGCILSP